MVTPRKDEEDLFLHWRKIEAVLRKNYGKMSVVKLARHFGLEKDSAKFQGGIQGLLTSKRASIVLGMDEEDFGKICRQFLVLNDPEVVRDAYTGSAPESMHRKRSI